MGSGVSFSPFAHLCVWNLAKGAVVETHGYRHRIYEQSTKGFTGISRDSNGKFLVNSEAEVMEFTLNPITRTHYFTAPYLNDVHFSLHDERANRIVVCNSGLDAIEVFDTDYVHVESIPLCRLTGCLTRYVTATLARYKRKVRDICLTWKHRNAASDFFAEDMRYKNLSESVLFANTRKMLFPESLYRGEYDLRYVMFRPHLMHPNFLCRIGDELLVTLKNTGKVVSLRDGGTVLSGLRGPHDGILRTGTYLLTEADSGTVLFATGVESVSDLKTRRMQAVRVCDPAGGFLRGVDLLDDDTAVAAVSKRREIGNDAGAAWFAVIDLANRSITDRFDIPREFGTNPFSVVNVSDFYP